MISAFCFTLLHLSPFLKIATNLFSKGFFGETLTLSLLKVTWAMKVTMAQTAVEKTGQMPSVR